MQFVRQHAIGTISSTPRVSKTKIVNAEVRSFSVPISIIPKHSMTMWSVLVWLLTLSIITFINRIINIILHLSCLRMAVRPTVTVSFRLLWLVRSRGVIVVFLNGGQRSEGSQLSDKKSKMLQSQNMVEHMSPIWSTLPIVYREKAILWKWV